MSNPSTSSDMPSAPAGTGCGCGHAVVFDGASVGYRRILAGVIAINAAAFVVVGIGSWIAGSASLAANTLDFAADAATYGLSLWAIGQSTRVRAGAALIKSASLAAMAAGILGFAVWRALNGATPEAGLISGLGLFGAAANLVAALLLVRYREGDANVRSVWLCTRNDLIQCLAVAATGVAVSVTGSRWPDLLVGVVLAAIFLRSAWQIATQAQRELEAVSSIPSARRLAFEREASAAKAAFARDDLDGAFRLLERAHILGQPWAGPHSWTHWMMLRIGFRRRDGREIRGQILRLAAGGVLSMLGRLPLGNTGGADVPARKPLPLPDDLAPLCVSDRR